MEKASFTRKEQIKKELTAQIAHLPANAPIPPELELARSFQVSRGTVRTAISELVSDGLLYRIQGSGTFKKGIAVNHFSSHVEGFSDQLIKSGLVPELSDISVSSCSATARLSGRLHVPVDHPLWRFIRTWNVAGRPISCGELFLRKDLVPGFCEKDLDISFLKTLRTVYGLRIASSESFVSAVPATPSLSRNLQIPPSCALLKMEYIGSLKDQTPVFLDTTYTVGDKYILHITQTYHDE